MSAKTKVLELIQTSNGYTVIATSQFALPQLTCFESQRLIAFSLTESFLFNPIGTLNLIEFAGDT